MKTQPFNRLNHCVYQLNYHLVLTTKYRRKCLSEPIQRDLLGIFQRTLEKWGCELLECNGEEDHMHLLVSLHPKIEIGKLVNNLKTVSSRLIRRDHIEHLNQFYRQRVLWHSAYFIVSCGGAPLEVLKEYIQNQGQKEDPES